MLFTGDIVVIKQGILWLSHGTYSAYHARNMVAIICIGYSTEGYWEMWIVENAWLFVVQFKLHKEHL